MPSFQENFENLQESIASFDVNDIDFNNVGSWPLAGKVVVWVSTFCVVLFGLYQVNLSHLYTTLKAEESKEDALKEEFEKKVMEAANLDAYRAQMLEMETSFEALLKQLPQDTEVPGLIEDISTKGLDSGLTFTSIDLKKEKADSYYIESPIEITVNGGYHDFGSFVSGIASLPRIVTLDDFLIDASSSSAGPAGKGKTKEVVSPGQLTMKINAKTYRYKPAGSEEEGA